MLKFIIFLLTYNATSEDSLIKYYLETGKLQGVEKILKSYTLKDTFLLAEFAYFNYKFEEAVELYKKIPSTRLECNDALARIILIQECRGGVKGEETSPLQDYVRAELLGRQENWTQGIKLLKRLNVGNRHACSLHSASIILLIQFFEASGRFESALKECHEFTTRFPENPKMPEVLLKEAEIYAKIGNQEQAERIYKEILLKYPKSSAAPVARMQLE